MYTGAVKKGVTLSFQQALGTLLDLAVYLIENYSQGQTIKFACSMSKIKRIELDNQLLPFAGI